MLLSSCDVPMVKWTWKRWALHPACHTPWNGGKSLGPGDGRWRDQQRKWLNENQFNRTAQDAINARKSAKKALKKKKKEELYKCPVNACELGRWKQESGESYIHLIYILLLLPCPFLSCPLKPTQQTVFQVPAREYGLPGQSSVFVSGWFAVRNAFSQR